MKLTRLRFLLPMTLALIASAGSAKAACDCGSTDPVNACTGNAVTYVREGVSIGFEFSCDGGACRCGQFANAHDYWVAPAVDGGTVVITNMTPAQTGSGSSLRNGAEVDPVSTDNEQGWDGTLRYAAERTISVPYAVDTAAKGRPVVVMKAKSHPANQPGHGKCNDDRMCLQYLESLTVVSTPPGDVFRPPYFGTEKPMIPASQLDTSILPALPEVGNEPDFDDALAAVTSPAVQHIYDWNTREKFHPDINYNHPNSGYDGYIQLRVHPAYLALLVEPDDQLQATKKELLARRVAQRGIDLYYIFKNGGEGRHPTCGGWLGNGGYGTGNLTPILITKSLLGLDATWGAHIDSVLSTEEGRQCFSETSMIQPPDPNGKNVALYGVKTTSVYTVSSSSKDAADPNGLVDGGGNAASECIAPYQSCCTTNIWRAGAMPMWLIPAVRQSFPQGAQHWLDFTDRIKRVGAYCDPNSFRGTPYEGYYKVGYTDSLYDAYRDCAEDGSCPGMPGSTAPPPAPALAPPVLLP